jgi:hypothetical protein
MWEFYHGDRQLSVVSGQLLLSSAQASIESN